MHFGYYLMIAALVLMGLEVLYAFSRREPVCSPRARFARKRHKPHARAVFPDRAGAGIRRNHAALAPGSPPRDSKFCRKIARRLTPFSARDNATGGSLRISKSEYQSCE